MATIVHSLLDRTLQKAWALCFGHLGLIFFGYAIPMWFERFKSIPNPIREITIAIRIVIDAVIAFAQIDFVKFMEAFERPGTIHPASFVFGRWGLAMAVAGLALVLLFDAVSFTFSLPHELRAWRVARDTRKNGVFASDNDIDAIKLRDPPRR